jgi:hypothetical protein
MGIIVDNLFCQLFCSEKNITTNLFQMKNKILLFLIALPAFSLMLRFGTYSMHDFHPFRQYEFHKCIQSKVFPCRWAPDSEMGYGEPLFNYYTQLPYWFGELFVSGGLSILNSVKLVFILSLVMSGVGMYRLARIYWGEVGAVVSAVLYMYAPYRSVDIWVRGALPEALAFVFYPFVMLGLHQYCKTFKPKYLVVFTLSLAALISTHNLSLIMFMPILGLYWLFMCLTTKSLKSIRGLALASLVSLGLSAYYLLPVFLESKYIDLSRTVQGYYDFHIHFATLRELFISRFWGYGGSLWMQKFLSISVGQIHWIVIGLSLVLLVRRRPASTLYFLVIVFLGTTALFLTHGKSVLIWNSLPFMKYIQFPWRYLTSATFFIALAGGFFVQLMPRRFIKLIGILIIMLTVFTNYSFFRPDIWQSVSDSEFFSGASWDFNRTAHKDYWPKTGGLPPETIAPQNPTFVTGTGSAVGSTQTAHGAEYVLEVTSEESIIALPIVYFPGWTADSGDLPLNINPGGKLGLITTNLSKGNHKINLSFENTGPRTLGNTISVITVLIFGIWIYTKKSSWSV